MATEPASRRDGTRDRPATEPGGCECLACGCIFIGAEWHHLCGVCHGEKLKPTGPGAMPRPALEG